MPLLIGTSGWQYRSWRERFYPAGVPQARWLEHYGARFQTVEADRVEPAVDAHVEAVQPGGDVGVQLRGQRHHLRLAGVDHRLADQPLVGAAGLQQRVPGLDVADDDHHVRCYESPSAARMACSPGRNPALT